MIDVDFVGVVRLMQLFGAGMVARGRGVVLSIGSQTAFAGGEQRGIYAAAKAAISQITKAAAVEWGPHGVRVVCLAPGRSITRMTDKTRTGSSGDRGMARVPLGRWGTVDEVAKLAVFLASYAASYLTGETVILFGGYVVGCGLRHPTRVTPSHSPERTSCRASCRNSPARTAAAGKRRSGAME